MSVDGAPAPTSVAASPLVRLASTWFDAGDRRYDLTTRALVVGVLSPSSAGEAVLLHDVGTMAEQGADLLELGPADAALAEAVAGLARRAELPLVTRGVATSVLADPSGDAGPSLLQAVAEAGGAVLLGGSTTADEAAVVLPGRLMVARAAGIADDAIALDVGASFASLGRTTGLGRPVAVGVDGPAEGRCEAVGTAVAAVRAGARIVRTRQVAAVRRSVDVLAAVLEAA